ncbi:hypothetical protein LCGC14_2667500, partial [marine sediment metagenome]
LYMQEVPEANWDAMATTSTITALTSTSVSYTNGATAVEQDELKGGYIVYENAGDAGEVHRILANHPAAASAVGKIYLYLTDVFEIACAIGQSITVTKNPFRDIVILPLATTISSMPVGIPPVIIAASSYGWIQTHGVASALIEGTVVIGQEGRPTESTTAADIGSIAGLDYDEGNERSDEDMGPVCRIIEVAEDTEFGTVFLMLEGLS